MKIGLVLGGIGANFGLGWLLTVWAGGGLMGPFGRADVWRYCGRRFIGFAGGGFRLSSGRLCFSRIRLWRCVSF